MESTKLFATAVLEGGNVYNLLDMLLVNKFGTVVTGIQALYGLSVLIS